jgi:hypothetical protein
MKEELLFGEAMTDRGWDVNTELSDRKVRRGGESVVERKDGRLLRGDEWPDPSNPLKESSIQVHDDVPEKSIFERDS